MKRNNCGLLLVVLFNLLFIACYGQKMSDADSLSRNRAEHLVKNCFDEELENNSYLLFSISDKWYLVIVELTDSYKEYFINSEHPNKNMIKIYTKPSKILHESFNMDYYHKGYINFNSAFYKSGYELAEGNMTYFFIRDKEGNKRGESRLSVIVKPNPIKEDVYNYLRTKLLEYISAKD